MISIIIILYYTFISLSLIAMNSYVNLMLILVGSAVSFFFWAINVMRILIVYLLVSIKDKVYDVKE